jgi:hypothetical protein
MGEATPVLRRRRSVDSEQELHQLAPIRRVFQPAYAARSGGAVRDKPVTEYRVQHVGGAAVEVRREGKDAGRDKAICAQRP